jgi:hypothetical protein
MHTNELHGTKFRLIKKLLTIVGMIFFAESSVVYQLPLSKITGGFKS